MPNLASHDAATMFLPNNEPWNEPLRTDYGMIIQDQCPEIGEPTLQPDNRTASSYIQQASAILDLSPDNHGWLLDLCKIVKDVSARSDREIANFAKMTWNFVFYL